MIVLLLVACAALDAVETALKDGLESATTPEEGRDTSRPVDSAGSGGDTATADTAVQDSGAPPDPDTGESPDADGDGYTVHDGDCDDTRADVHPGAEDDCFDSGGADMDCSGDDYACDDTPATSSWTPGTSTDPVDPWIAAVGDVDGDGFDDVVAEEIGGATDPVWIFRGDADLADGGLAIEVAASAETASGEALGLADVDGDGLLDLLHVAGTPQVILGATLLGGSPTLDDASVTLTVAGDWTTQEDTLGTLGDLDGDGLADLWTSARASADRGLFAYTGATLAAGGVLTTDDADAYVIGAPGTDGAVATVGDVDGDGLDEVFLSTLNKSFLVPGDAFLPLDGAPRSIDAYRTTCVPRDPMFAAALGDLDGDGLADYAVAATYDVDDTAVCFGSGAVTWVGPRTYSSVWSDRARGVGDFDADGRDDVAFFGPYDDIASGLLLVSGVDVTPDASLEFSSRTSRYWLSGLVADGGDLDGDGARDLLVASRGVLHLYGGPF